ncbi:MAG: exosortase [Kiritimatiellae bacterium]|nr:exosortase [Kiritimatiellia bacterium]
MKIRCGLAVLSMAALAVGFRAMVFSHLPAMFNAPEEDLSFGWYVPLFSLYVLWTERKELLKSAGSPSWAGAALCLPFVFLGLLGARGLQVRFELLAFAGLLVALPWAIFGRGTAKRVLFPAAFLLFCMPLNSYLSLVTVHLRLLVSAVSSGLLSGFGMDIVRQGNLIALPGVVIGGETFVIDIANPCSGLRSIFALLALSAGYGYFTQPTWTRRAMLFALAVPCAVAGNILRIVTICIAAKTCTPAFAVGFYHDFAGYVVFLVALAMLVGCGGLLSAAAARMGRRRAASAEGEAGPLPGGETFAEEETSVPEPCGRGSAPAFAAVLCTVAAMAFQTVAPNPRVAEAPEAGLPLILDVNCPSAIGRPLPEEFGFSLPDVPAGTQRFVGMPIGPSVAETNLLIGAEISKRAYMPGVWNVKFPEYLDSLRGSVRLKENMLKALEASGKGEAAEADLEARRAFLLRDALTLFSVSTVTSGPDKQSLHRPELCLPSQGFDMGESKTLRIGDIDWRVIRLAAKGGRGEALFAYTFFNQEGYRTDSHVARIVRDTWDRTFRNTVDRWVMVSVQLYIPDEGLLGAVLDSLKNVGMQEGPAEPSKPETASGKGGEE